MPKVKLILMSVGCNFASEPVTDYNILSERVVELDYVNETTSRFEFEETAYYIYPDKQFEGDMLLAYSVGYIFMVKVDGKWQEPIEGEDYPIEED